MIGSRSRTADGKVAGPADRRRCCERLWLRTLCVVGITVLPVTASALALDVEAVLLDGRIVTGRLLSIAPDIGIAADSQTVTLGWPEVLTIRPIAPPNASQPDTGPVLAGDPSATSLPANTCVRFLLSDGSTFAGCVVANSPSDFTVRFGDEHTCRLELSMISSIRAVAVSADAKMRLDEVMREEQPTADLAVVSRGDKTLVLRGAVKRVTPTDVIFAWNEKDVPLPWQRLAGVRLAKPSPRSSACAVHLAGGDVFAGRVREGNDATITLQSSVFEKLELPWSRIDKIESRSERLVLLSELHPANYLFEPFFDKTWPYAVDRTLSGKPIRLGGREFPRGLSMHSRSTLMYRIDRAFSRFAATAGIADEMENRGCVTMQVLGDGHVLWEAKEVRGGQPPRAVAVDIAGVTELSLVVDFGDDLDLSDHACWAFARLIR